MTTRDIIVTKPCPVTISSAYDGNESASYTELRRVFCKISVINHLNCRVCIRLFHYSWRWTFTWLLGNWLPQKCENYEMSDSVNNSLSPAGNFQLVLLHGTTTGLDIFDAELQYVKQYSLNLFRLVCMTIDGAPAMTGERKGGASLLVCHYEATGHTQPIHKVHCIIHQESMCSKSSSSPTALTTASSRH